MSMSEDDYAYDEYISSLYEEHYKEAIEEFTGERLSSYYNKHNLLAKPAFDFFIEAKKQNAINPTVCLLFAAIAMEVGLKAILLKPIIYGLVHDESAASLITDLTLSHAGMDRYRKLFLHILKEYGSVDLSTFKRKGSCKTFWEERKQVQEIRNSIMHKANKASQEDADLALDIASEILEKIFPEVVTRMGFHLHDSYQICSDWNCERKGSKSE